MNPASPGQALAPPLVGTSSSIAGITAVNKANYAAPCIIITGREKDGKCQSGNSLILDPTTGRLARLADLVASRDGHVSTWSFIGLKAVRPSDFINNGRRQTFRLKTQSGRVNEATSNHPFLTRRGWVKLEDLRPEDRVAIVTENPVFGAAHGWFREVNGGENASLKLLAYAIADGSLGHSALTFTKNEDEVRDEFVEAVRLVGDDCTEVFEAERTFVRVRGRVRGESRVRGMLEDAGLWGKLSAEKFIPDRVFSQPQHRLRLFLNRLFTCDGSFESKGVVSYSSTSHLLVKQIQHLLTRFGVYCRIREKHIEGALYGSELRITSRDDVLKFIDEVGFYGEKQARAQAGRAAIAATIANPTQTDRLGPIVFDRITSIEPCGEQEVFDLTIDETHNFVADDFVVHNSSLAATLFGFPSPQHQPLIIAADPSGPDSCIAMGYAVHAIRLNEMNGTRWFDRARAALDVIERNIAAIRAQYGAVVFDDASTISYRMLEDARRSSKNPDPRSHYQTMYTQFNELWWRLNDMNIPLVWLAWMGEPGMTESGGTELAAPDIAGKRFARTIAGRSQHNFLLEKRMVGKGAQGADQHGYARLLHSIPWNGQNAGGRFAHLLPEPCPPDLSWILRRIKGE